MKGQHKQDWRRAMVDGRKRWNEMSPARRVSSIVIALIQFGLLGVALIDLRRRPAEQIRGPKRLWMFVVFINWVGPISYFVFGRLPTEKVTSP